MTKYLFLALAIFVLFGADKSHATDEPTLAEQTEQSKYHTEIDTAAAQKEKIYDVVAGQAMRQGKLEKQFIKNLQNTELLSSEYARESARKAYEASKNQKMKDFGTTYHENILAHVRNEMQSYGEDFDLEYLQKLTAQNQDSEVYDSSHLYVFISESVPEHTIFNYLSALEKVPTIYVLRGLIGNELSNFMPTKTWVQKLLCRTKTITEDTQCSFGPIDINPTLYRAFGIREVPALVYIKDPKKLLSCGEKSLSEEDFFVWYGDTNPEYALKMFARNSPNDPTLLKLISSLKSTIWSNEQGEKS